MGVCSDGYSGSDFILVTGISGALGAGDISGRLSWKVPFKMMSLLRALQVYWRVVSGRRQLYAPWIFKARSDTATECRKTDRAFFSAARSVLVRRPQLHHYHKVNQGVGFAAMIVWS